MNPFDYFKEIHLINLDKRTDRLNNVMQEFEKLGIKDRVQRFKAIEKTDGRLGCIKSHVELLKYAKAKKLENILILEDDITFVQPNTNEILNNAIQQLNMKWNLLYFGANTHTKLFKLTENLIYLNNAFATHSLAYHESIYDKIINKYDKMQQLTKHTDILDVYYCTDLQVNNTCLLVNPILTTQVNGFSDIEKRDVNYEFILDRFKTNIK